MRRFVPYTALALYLSVLPATAADRYGGWLLEQPRSSVFRLSEVQVEAVCPIQSAYRRPRTRQLGSESSAGKFSDAT
jgi:hypothetical protein